MAGRGRSLQPSLDWLLIINIAPSCCSTLPNAPVRIPTSDCFATSGDTIPYSGVSSLSLPYESSTAKEIYDNLYSIILCPIRFVYSFFHLRSFFSVFPVSSGLKTWPEYFATSIDIITSIRIFSDF